MLFFSGSRFVCFLFWLGLDQEMGGIGFEFQEFWWISLNRNEEGVDGFVFNFKKVDYIRIGWRKC